MAIDIKDDKTDRVAHELAAETGLKITDPER